MKYYLIAGEASGDMHGANLMTALKSVDDAADFRYCGGEKMTAVGGTLYNHYKENNYMGFLEVAKHLRKILKYMNRVKADIVAFKPDAIVLIDYPGFNLRIAEFAKKNNIQVHYYISPQIWAWKESRITKIKANIDYLYCILPFEKPFYKKHNYEVDYVGNPLLDQIASYSSSDDFPVKTDLPILAILPGSRMMELNSMLPVMVKVAEKLTGYQPIIAAAPSIDSSYFEQYTKGKIPIVYNNTYELLNRADLAIVTSGTATLETALFKIPQVVCYKSSKITYVIAKNLVKIKYISLANLILDKLAIPELIQDDMNVDRILKELTDLKIGPKRDAQLQNYEELASVMGKPGASLSVATKIISRVKQSKV